MCASHFHDKVAGSLSYSCLDNGRPDILGLTQIATGLDIINAFWCLSVVRSAYSLGAHQRCRCQ